MEKNKALHWRLNRIRSACNCEEFAVHNNIPKEAGKYQDNILFTYPAVKALKALRPGFPLLIRLFLPVRGDFFLRNSKTLATYLKPQLISRKFHAEFNKQVMRSHQAERAVVWLYSKDLPRQTFQDFQTK